MFILHLYEKPAEASLNANTCMSILCRARQKKELTSYCKVVNNLLATYSTDDILAEVDIDIMSIKQLAGQSAVEYSPALWMKALR